MPEPRPDSAETAGLLAELAAGHREVLDRLLDRHRRAEFVEAHLDSRVRVRVAPSDIVHNAFMEICRRMDDFLSRRQMPFHLSARKTAYERMLNAVREHRQSQRRSVLREAPLPDRSSVLLARSLMAGGPSPEEVLQAREQVERLSQAIAALEQDDRDVLLMRHMDDLPFEEIACLLDITPAAARQRCGRAIRKLGKALHGLHPEGPSQ